MSSARAPLSTIGLFVSSIVATCVTSWGRLIPFGRNEAAGHVTVLAALEIRGIILLGEDAILPFEEGGLLEAVREILDG